MSLTSNSSTLKCAIYARVSTDDQTCELQLRELREYCSRRKWTIIQEYVDTGWSGKLASRPELDRLKQDAREHRFDCVLVWKLDRWGRSVMHSVQSIKELGALGIRWIAVTQNLDTDQSNPMAWLLLHIMAAFAEFERETIRERVMAGMKAAKHQGKHCGRKKAVFDRRKAIALHRAGRSVREIASILGIGRGTAHRIVSQKGSRTEG